MCDIVRPLLESKQIDISYFSNDIFVELDQFYRNAIFSIQTTSYDATLGMHLRTLYDKPMFQGWRGNKADMKRGGRGGSE